jgi:L-amino acid N-acyltransferase YncA
MGAAMDLRQAQSGDLAAVAEIYNHYVLHSTCTFAEEPEGPDYWRDWFETHTGINPAIVAINDGQIVGWGTLSKWNRRCAYRFSVEDSVYVRPGLHRQGIGRTLLVELIRLAKTHGHHNIVAQIAEGQEPSEALHAALGFRRAGVLEKIGFKFDRWLDVGIWQLRLAQP